MAYRSRINALQTSHRHGPSPESRRMGVFQRVNTSLCHLDEQALAHTCRPQCRHRSAKADSMGLVQSEHQGKLHFWTSADAETLGYWCAEL